MSTKSRNPKSKTSRRRSTKKRTDTLTQKNQNQSQSLKYARNLSNKESEYSKDNIRSKATPSIDSLLKAKRVPPKYFDNTDHYRKQSLEILRNISIIYLEFQKDLLINYKETSYKFIDDIKEFINPLFKQSLTPENYLVVYNNMNKKIYENINRTTSLINNIVETNLNSLSNSLDIYQKYYEFLNLNYFSKKS